MAPPLLAKIAAQVGAKAARKADKKAKESGVPGGALGLAAGALLAAFLMMVSVVAGVGGGVMASLAAVPTIACTNNTGGPRLSSVGDIADIPTVALDAYVRAGNTARLDWTVIAGIGWIESGHGTANGSNLDEDGRAVPPILGIVLNGSGVGGNVTPIYDTDNGALDGDTRYDRAVGPMQFLPSTWKSIKKDGNGDHEFDPQNIYDAALGTAFYLKKVGAPENMESAVARYNGGGAHAAAYAVSVMEKAAEYAAAADAAANAVDSVTGSNVDGPGLLPVPAGSYGIGAVFGQKPRNNTYWQWKGYHTGLDFSVPQGTRVTASKGGFVNRVGWDDNYGNYAVVLIAPGVEQWYAHLSRAKVSKGQTVKAGDLVGRSGNTGTSTGPHLHFEVRVSGQPVNPAPYLPAVDGTPGADPTSPNLTPADLTPGAASTVFVVGDSLTVGVRDMAPWSFLEGLRPGTLFTPDAENGRPLSAGIAALRTNPSAQSAAMWIVALGTNDWAADPNVHKAGIAQVMDLAGGKPVIWVNVYRGQRYPDPATDPFNVALQDSLATYGNLRVADWATAVKNRSDLFTDADLVHVNADGYRLRAQVMVDLLQDTATASDCQGPGGMIAALGGSDYAAAAAIAIRAALDQVGEPYSYSASPPDSWDCSKLTGWAWGQAGVKLTYYSYAQASETDRVCDGVTACQQPGVLLPGDILFYFVGATHHVAMYIGDGKIVEASSPRTGVRVTDVWNSWATANFSFAGRVRDFPVVDQIDTPTGAAASMPGSNVPQVRSFPTDENVLDAASKLKDTRMFAATATRNANERRSEWLAWPSTVAPGTPRAVAVMLLSKYGWPISQWPCVDRLWWHESEWNYTAGNRSHYGIPQATPGSKMASVAADWSTNPVTQIKWGYQYIKQAYGTPCSAWSKWMDRAATEKYGWY